MLQRKAFTLIEMLVVCVIIMILLTLIGPSIGRSRYAARQARCASNKHEIMIGLINYCADNLNRYPNESLPTWVGYYIQDHTPIFFPTLRDKYGVSFPLWSCAVAGDHLIPWDWNGWKWKMASTGYWVMRGSSGTAMNANPTYSILSDRLSRQQPRDVVVSDAIFGDGPEPSSSSHSYNGKVEHGVVAHMDGSSRIVHAEEMVKRCNMGWGWWWY